MSKPESPLYEFGEFQLDAARRLLLRRGKPVTIAPKVYDVLLVLVETAGQSLSKDELLSRVWPDTVVGESNLTVSVSALRKVLGEGRGEHQFIATLPGTGYQFVAPVARVSQPENDLPVASALALLAAPSGLQLERQTISPFVIEAATEEEVQASPLALNAPRRRFTKARRWLAVGGVVLVLVGAWAWYFWYEPPATVGQVRSLAVLPFSNLGGPQADEMLGVGLADALITRLSNIGSLAVRPTGAIQYYVSPQRDTRAIAQKLDVEAVLDGHLQRNGEQVRLTLQLIRAADGVPLWAESFEEPFTNLLAVQQVISERVAHALTLQLNRVQRQRLQKNYTANPEAFQAYLNGRYFWGKRTPAEVKKAIGYFRQAIELDPSYALAWSGLADSYLTLGVPSVMLSAENAAENIAKARAAAEKALQLDDTLAEAHTSLGGVLATEIVHEDAAGHREYARAIELNPNYAAVYQYQGLDYIRDGEPALALAALQRAHSLDPLSGNVYTHMGSALYYLRRYPEAATQLNKALELDPKLIRAHLALGRVYEAQQQYDAAIASHQTAARLSNNGPFVLSSLGHAYALQGRRAEAEQLLAQVHAAYDQGKIPAYYSAILHLALGETTQALDWLEKKTPYYPVGVYKVDPYLDSLRAEARFQALFLPGRRAN